MPTVFISYARVDDTLPPKGTDDDGWISYFHEALSYGLKAWGRSDLKIVSSYENQAMLDALNRGDILAFATQYPVGEGAIAIDQAVRLIEKKPVMSLVQPVATVIDKTTVPKLQMDLVLAPASWTPVYSVKAK